MKGVAEWLKSIGLWEYAQRFGENGVDLSVLRDLSDDDLKELGVLLGHRRKLLRAIAELEDVGLHDVPMVTDTGVGARPIRARAYSGTPASPRLLRRAC